MKTAPTFGKKKAPAPVATARQIAESVAREWVGHKGPLDAATLRTVARLASESL